MVNPAANVCIGGDVCWRALNSASSEPCVHLGCVVRVFHSLKCEQIHSIHRETKHWVLRCSSHSLGSYKDGSQHAEQHCTVQSVQCFPGRTELTPPAEKKRGMNKKYIKNKPKQKGISQLKLSKSSKHSLQV